MEILHYNELDTSVIPNFDKFAKSIEANDFKSADVKKVDNNLYRARLNITDRLLFSIYKYNGKAYALILEFIKNHDYASSRFLRHVSVIDDDKIPSITTIDETDVVSLVYLNKSHNSVNLLDKIISFDESQHSIYELNPPLVIIGSAGSGKTALTLEKMKQVTGDVLYVTQSEYLVQNSRELYYANNYANNQQNVALLSFQAFLESIQQPKGKPVTFQHFKQWFARHRQNSPVKDAHKLFEEFRGVLTGSVIDKNCLSLDDYASLGVKQSIFLQEERDAVYNLFEKYLAFLAENTLYDSNIISHDYLQHLVPRYDFVVVDEVQDLTNIQLYLILKSLRQSNNFILCGDSNQIVHPNFFSWSNVKRLFCEHDDLQMSDQLIRILNTNYRNAPQLTEIANRILKIKNLRFGSIDKESHYLITSNEHNSGEVLFLQNTPKILQELNVKTKASTLFAVIVMNDEQKDAARKHFGTPLIFTIQEAKGLEYENIILYNFLSLEETRYREIAYGVNVADLNDDLTYSRAKDKVDKSGEVYKFYINTLYVAVTRAIKNLYWIEGNLNQPFLNLLNLSDAQTSVELENKNSSLDEWREEARKLELQGKQEQADLIRKEILKEKTPPWKVITPDVLSNLKQEAFEKKNKSAMSTLFEYALIYGDNVSLELLWECNFNPKIKNRFDYVNFKNKIYEEYFLVDVSDYSHEKLNIIEFTKQIKKFGIDFPNKLNQTPLIRAGWFGNKKLFDYLLGQGANIEKTDNINRTALDLLNHYKSEFSNYNSEAQSRILTWSLKYICKQYLDSIDLGRIDVESTIFQYNFVKTFWSIRGSLDGFLKSEAKIEAIKCFKYDINNQNHREIQKGRTLLGLLYYFGSMVKQDYTKSMLFFYQAAEEGEPIAQLYVGRIYYDGSGTKGTASLTTIELEQDYVKAIQWFTKAAEQGHAMAQNNLATCYTHGYGSANKKPDFIKAAYWFHKAAEQGLAEAQYNLAGHYNNEISPENTDMSKAIYWYEKAAKQGHSGAQRSLGSAYLSGQGVPKNYEKGKYWWRKAAKQGDELAKSLLQNY